MEILTENMFFGIFISLISYEIGLMIYRKTKIPIFNPLLLAMIFIIGFLKAFNLDIEVYNQGGQFINMFLGPATVILAVPLYKQFELLKKNFMPIIIGIFLGSLIGIVSTFILSTVFGLNSVLTISLLPKSVTTPIGIEITNSLGGISSVTVLAIIISGIVGAIVAPTVCKVFKIKDPVAKGICIGTSAHAVGTSKALEMGETEGAMSSLSIGIAGILTVFLVPLCFNILSKLF